MPPPPLPAAPTLLGAARTALVVAGAVGTLATGAWLVRGEIHRAGLVPVAGTVVERRTSTGADERATFFQLEVSWDTAGGETRRTFTVTRDRHDAAGPGDGVLVLREPEDAGAAVLGPALPRDADPPALASAAAALRAERRWQGGVAVLAALAVLAAGLACHARLRARARAREDASG